MMLLQIKELAEKTGLSTDSIRFYEKKNLIQPSLRADNNYRYYDERNVEKSCLSSIVVSWIFPFKKSRLCMRFWNTLNKTVIR